MKLSQRLAIGFIRTKFKLLTLFSKKRTAQQAFGLFSTPLLRSKRKTDIRNAELLNFRMGDLTIHGYRWNHPRPEKVLILHGFSSAAHKFEHFAEPLVQKGYEVLAFDAPAHGESDGSQTNAIEYSEMIKAVIDAFGPVKNFISHSFGGIALTLALENIPHDESVKAVFIAPATETTSAIDGAFTMLRLKNKVVRDEFEKIVVEISGRQSAWFSMRRAMHNINAKILWIHDEDDDVTPWADAQKVKEDNHPNINFVITKGLGHRKIYHDPAVENKIMEFF
jgi:pimeloyl-ACP methyl ester carboxylesterase